MQISPERSRPDNAESSFIIMDGYCSSGNAAVEVPAVEIGAASCCTIMGRSGTFLYLSWVRVNQIPSPMATTAKATAAIKNNGTANLLQNVLCILCMVMIVTQNLDSLKWRMGLDFNNPNGSGLLKAVLFVNKNIFILASLAFSRQAL